MIGHRRHRPCARGAHRAAAPAPCRSIGGGDAQLLDEHVWKTRSAPAPRASSASASRARWRRCCKPGDMRDRRRMSCTARNAMPTDARWTAAAAPEAAACARRRSSSGMARSSAHVDGKRRAASRLPARIAVDMESHIAARIARRHDIPFVGAARRFPMPRRAACRRRRSCAMKPDGAHRLGARAGLGRCASRCRFRDLMTHRPRGRARRFARYSAAATLSGLDLAARISASLFSTWRENTNSAGRCCRAVDVRRHRAVGLHAAHRERDQLVRMLDRVDHGRAFEAAMDHAVWRISRTCRRRTCPSRCLPSVP